MNEADEKAWHDIREARASLILAKPNDGSPNDRYYAIAITEIEKVVAVFYTYLIDHIEHQTPET